MKCLFASDLHGSESACKAILSRYKQESADRLVLLGDLLYHSPRNPLPDDYNPEAVFCLLNAFPHSPLCVRGNCDAEVDQMVLQFPIMADYCLLPLKNDVCAFVTHGHLFNTDNPPPHKPGDILIHGHTHIHCVLPQEDYVYINPGSAAMPKNNQPKSYMVYEEGLFSIKDLDGNILLKHGIR